MRPPPHPSEQMSSCELVPTLEVSGTATREDRIYGTRYYAQRTAANI
jgi:hypothetical protein